MSASKQEYITMQGRLEDYRSIPPEVRQCFKIKYIDELDVDYSQCPQWVAQKKVSDKEFKKLKEIEFEYRHSKK